MKKKLAVYAGSFDPLTIGHLWMIEQGAKLFDQLMVAIGVNPEKKCMFSVDERFEMLRESTLHLPNVGVSAYGNQFLITYVQCVADAKFILRGIRTESDYEYERTMRNINSDLDPNITTVFLMPPREIAEVSSSMVKGLVGPKGWENIVKKYVPEPIFNKLKALHLQNQNKQQWLALWQRIGTKGNVEDYESLSMCYKEPHRAYHTLLHIAHCLAELEQARYLAINPDAVEMAIWHHDAIYDTRAKDNEEKSAELARTVLKNASLSDEFIARVVNLILATKHTVPPTDPDAKLIADIDLSSLGIADELFDENGRQIRQEYKEVPEELFMAGRLEFLKSLLKRETIYFTQFLFDKYEVQARKNIARAIAQLSK